jgi:hypothetical protein
METYRGQVKRTILLSRDDHDHKIGARKQRRDAGKYSFVNKTIKLWYQLHAEALVTFLCKSHIFRKRVTKVILREKCGDKMTKSAGK